MLQYPFKIFNNPQTPYYFTSSIVLGSYEMFNYSYNINRHI